MRPLKSPSKKRRTGSVVEKKGVDHLYLLFYYLGHRVELPTYMPVGQESRAKLESWLNTHMPKITAGTFRFAEALPAADPEKIEFFTRLEIDRGIRASDDGLLNQCAEAVTVDDAIKRFISHRVNKWRSVTKAEDAIGVLQSRILPYWRGKFLTDINKQAVIDFVCYLREGGQPILSGEKCQDTVGLSRARMIVRTFKCLWGFASETYRVPYCDPFDDELSEYLPEAKAKTDADGKHVVSQVWSYDEVMLILKHMHPHYVKATRAFFLTGTITSELAGLRNIDVLEDTKIRNFIIRKKGIGYGGRKEKKTAEDEVDGKDRGKKPHRTRSIPTTKALLECFDTEDLEAQNPRRLFSAPKGGPLRQNNFHTVWSKALNEAGLPHRSPYSMRHTFACWSLYAGKEPLEVSRLMGHKSKRMVYEVYGAWVPKLKGDKARIRDFFGEDFFE